MPLGVAGGSSLNPVDFRDKVSTNVDNVICRINGIAPQFSEEEETQRENVATVEPPQSVQRGVAELVEAALAARNLCMMDPTWHPWF